MLLPNAVNGVTLYRTMDAPPSLDVPVTRPLVGRVIGAFGDVDGTGKLAMVCVVFGWFFMNTLVVNLGSLEHGVRFFDMSAVIADPTRLFFGVDASFHRGLFGLLCLICVAAPLAPHVLLPELLKPDLLERDPLEPDGLKSPVLNRKTVWLFYLAPLALMVACGALLYARSSGEFFAAPPDPKSMSASIMHFANDLVRRGSDLVSRHISVGAGGYLGFIGSVVLAVQGLRRFRHA
jgi:hypothetical protein